MKMGGLLGSGGDEVSVAIGGEEIARACASSADIFDVQLCLCTAPIFLFGNEEQRLRFVRSLVKGEKIGAFAITESEAGSDVSHMKTTAVREGDYYVKLYLHKERNDERTKSEND